MDEYSIVAFGEPLTEVFLNNRPSDDQLQNTIEMARLLRGLPIHASSGDVFNFLGNYISLKKLISDKLALEKETVGLLTVTGDDRFGRNLKKAFLSLENPFVSIDRTLFQLKRGEKSGLYGVFVEDKRGNYRFYFDRFGYAFENALSENSLDYWIETGEKAKYFYTTGIALAMTKDYRLFRVLFERLASKGTKIIFDTNYRKDIFKHFGTVNPGELLEELLPYINILLAGEGDLRHIYPETAGLNTEDLISKLTDYFQNRGLDKEKIIFKCGEKGIYYYGKRLIHFNARKAELKESEDGRLHPEGAGDSFNSGFMLRIIHGGGIVRAINLGLLTASFKVRFRGCFRREEPFEGNKKELKD